MATINMNPQIADILLTRKDTFGFEFEVIEDDTGDPIDFTGGTVVLTVNEEADGSGTDIFSISPTNTLDDTGILRFQPSATQNDCPAGTYYYDVEWSYGSSVRTIVRGKWSIQPDISN